MQSQADYPRSFSFELFPPKTESGFDKLKASALQNPGVWGGAPGASAHAAANESRRWGRGDRLISTVDQTLIRGLGTP